MNYNTFKDRFDHFRIFSVNDIKKSFTDFDTRRLVEWQKKGYIQKVINRWYVFTDVEVDDHMKFLMANRIYQPSYVSLESALSYYNLIPEAVFTTTSLTSNKTNSFNTPKGNYSYRHIKSSLFFGYQIIEWQGFPIKMAEFEKVILDYLYLNPQIKSIRDLQSLRLNIETLIEYCNIERLNAYHTLFDSKALKSRLTLLLRYLNLC